MDPWPFIIAAYGLTLAGTLAISVWAWNGALAAERKADAPRERD
jgi:hypothetical protein